ncbi:10288_t:CDS:2 [Ambispora gerdemannii]|uniref:10288_t:CDS:1 n=1 Tax=Ambispora gerdemannii TaxID=144530 RepID=A0A9N9GVD3_9GLOM|nr:10288_t:CDS:2 [Ambispora gerdemannii]
MSLPKINKKIAKNSNHLELNFVKSRKNIKSDNIYWSDALETRLRQLYAYDNIVDVFWGRRITEHLAGNKRWHVYVVTRDPFEKTEKVAKDEVIYFISEIAGFVSAEIHPQSPDDQLPAWKKVPQDLQNNLVGTTTGYKRTDSKFTDTPAIILYVRQKGILRCGCGGPFPKMIRGFLTDVVEAYVVTPCVGLTGSRNMIGTLDVAVVENTRRIGIISCEHVVKFKDVDTTSESIQPSHEDLLDAPERKLRNITLVQNC